MPSLPPSLGDDPGVQPASAGDDLALRENKMGNLFQSTEDFEQYKKWQQAVPMFVRTILEAAIFGRTVRIDPSLPPLTRQFLHALQELLLQPEKDCAQIAELDPRLQRILQPLQAEATGKETVNVYRVLGSKDYGFPLKLQWYEARLAPRLQWVLEQDRGASVPETQLMTIDDKQTLKLSMDEVNKSKEEITKGEYVVHPAYAGYYRGLVCEQWDPAALVWRATERTLRSVSQEEDCVPETRRFMRGLLQAGKTKAVDLPYEFAIDPHSLPFGVTAFQDQYDVWYLHNDLNEPKECEWSIAKMKSYRPTASPPLASKREMAILPDELQSLVRDSKSASTMPTIERARAIVASVRNGLKYSNNEKLSHQYRSNPGLFFSQVWEHKEADCDVANALAAEVLFQAGMQVRMVVGHSISSQTKGGSAILHGGTRHAWLEVKDPKWEDHWVRLDATPAGDPNVDEEQQEEDLQARSRGVKDVPKELSDDLWRVKSDIDKEEQRVEESVRRDSRGEIFKAKRVEKEEEVLQKIQTLRQRYGGVLEECRRAWHAVVSKNLAKQQEEQDYTGPVPPDIGDELDEDSIVAIPIAQRSRDPLPLAFRAPQRKVTFDTVSGGYELYIGADVSLSMKDKDFTSGLRKCDAQRDAVFLFVDSIMQNVAETKRAGLLKDALPVRVCVATYAGDTSIVLPLTEQWGIDEQVKLYDALETFRSGTRDDITLRNFQKIMAESPSCDDSKMHRAILMFSDGGTQEQDSVRNEIAKMRIQGMVVAGFGITNEGRAMEAAYAPDGRTIENVEQLPDAGIRYIVNLLNTWYNT